MTAHVSLIALKQLNSKVGDLAGNYAKHVNAIREAKKQDAACIVFPELSLCGYPPEDLLLRPAFTEANQYYLDKLLEESNDIICIVGHAIKENNLRYNACSVLHHGKILKTHRKMYLPNYGVFDECRYFNPGLSHTTFELNGTKTALLICEDVWQISKMEPLISQGVRLVIIVNASPYETNKHEQRFELLERLAREHTFSIIYVNTIGGQDELVFDGGSMVFNPEGQLCYLAPFFAEDMALVRYENDTIQAPAHPITPSLTLERLYQALVLGLRDYINKNHIKGVVLGLSGGIDSALCLCIAVDALGKDRVHALIMPSRYSASISEVDAIALALALGVTHDVQDIEPFYQVFLEQLSALCGSSNSSIVEQNLQARTRGMILMAYSNSTDYLVLTSGNRSEIAVGYCTLYGDMVGGFAPIKDIFKTKVYELARAGFGSCKHIPKRTLERAPSAELAFEQTDQDTLPSYDVLDPILDAYLNEQLDADAIIAKGFLEDVVMKVIKMVRHNEFKRKQSAIGTHVNLHSFGKDWRMPITNGFGT